MERKVRQVQLKGCVFQTTQLHIKCHLTMSKFQCSLHLANFFAKWAKLCDCQFQKCIKHEHCGERGFQTLFDDCTIILFEASWCLYTTKLLGLVRWSYFSMRMHCSHCSIYILLSWLGMSTAKTIVKNCNLHTWIPFPMPLLRHISVCKASPFFSHALVALTTGWPLPFEQLYFSDNQHLTKWKWGAPSLQITCIMDHEKWENFKEDIVTLCWNYYSETVAAFYTISVI